MPPTTTKEHQRERNRRKMASWRARNKERAREQTRRSMAKLRGKRVPAEIVVRPVKPPKPAPVLDNSPALKTERERRIEIIKQRLKLIKKTK